MKTLDIYMMFWTDGLPNSTRERNVKYSEKELYKLSQFLRSQNINCNAYVYDYSPTQLIENSIHKPYPLAIYKRAEKINHLLEKSSSDLFSIIDSDCFIHEKDYQKLADTINNCNESSCITFDVLDFDTHTTELIIKNKISLDECTGTSRFPGRAGGLGAFFIVSTASLRESGGFNTKFTTWGGEDGEIYDKIDRSSSIRKIPIKCTDIRLFHLNHFSDRENIKYFDREEYLRNNF